MITNVIVTNRHDAKTIVTGIRNGGGRVCWITISNLDTKPLVNGSNKHILVCKFDDISYKPITHKQMCKIKRFIMNHHINMIHNFTLVVNCHAGISRSAAIGVFCKYKLKIDVKFGDQTFPNAGIMKALGLPVEFWNLQLQEAIWDDEHAMWRT